ncbi:restriction endonuclease subunit S [Mycolicibacterium fortuitum]|uniref:restriction endonuclease subunit S n=1 Tax=Mycolicibacterium fortuitum TaxID=1766 RepID=UPI003AAB5002
MSAAILPSGWRRSNIRHFAAMKTGHTPSRSVAAYWDNTTIPWFTLADVWQLRDGRRTYLGDTASQISELGLANSAAELLPAGTVVLSRTASVGFTGIMPRPMATSQDFWNWVCGDELLPEYLNFQLRSMAPQLRGLNMGSTHQTIYKADAAAIEILVPPVPEQRAIVDFLDRETARVDALIDEQQRLITLLRERRAAVITDAAVTGIDDAPLVDSGNVYLGAVPGHWTVGRFSRDVEINGGQVDPREAPWADMILVAPNHVESGTGAIIGRETARMQGADSGKYVASAGQLLYSKIRPALNKVAVAGEDCLISADMYAMSSRKGDDHRYLQYYMLARPFHTFATLASQRVKMPKINRAELGEAPWLRPPIDEQIRIVAYIDKETAKVDTLIAENERFIELARERRSALITAAVTGQIDVRNEVA